MTILVLTKFLHLILGMAFFGALLVSYLTIVRMTRGNSVIILQQTLQRALIMDVFLLVLLLGQFATGSLLVPLEQRTFTTPWIQAAYGLLCFILLLWALLFYCKTMNWWQLKHKIAETLRWPCIYHVSYVLMILLLCGIIHDAVTKTTFLPYHLL